MVWIVFGHFCMLVNRFPCCQMENGGPLKRLVLLSITIDVLGKLDMSPGYLFYFLLAYDFCISRFQVT
jgi:hypothetical protein